MSKTPAVQTQTFKEERTKLALFKPTRKVYARRLEDTDGKVLWEVFEPRHPDQKGFLRLMSDEEFREAYWPDDRDGRAIFVPMLGKGVERLNKQEAAADFKAILKREGLI